MPGTASGTIPTSTGKTHKECQAAPTIIGVAPTWPTAPILGSLVGVPSGRWLTLEEAAQRLGLSSPDVLAMIRNRRLPGLLVDGIWRVRLADVEALKRPAAADPKSARSAYDTLTKLGYISDVEITRFLSVQYRVPAVNLEEYEIDREVLKTVSRDLCEKHMLLPVSRAGPILVMAMADPTDARAIDDVKFHTGFDVEPVVAPEAAILAAIERYYGSKDG